MTRAAPPAGPVPGELAGTAAKLPSLTGLRFIAAALVFFYHSSQTFTGPTPPYGPVTPFADSGWAAAYANVFDVGGYVGVSFFFVLSGFVLTWSSKDGERTTAFLRRRLLKIYPTHVVMWAIAMILFAASVTPLSGWLPNAFLLHAFSPDLKTFNSVNGPSWSLCAELLFYLSFPVLIRLVRRIGDRALWAWAAVTVAGMFGVALVTRYLVPATPTIPFIPGISIPQLWFGYFFPPARLFEFVLGMLLARIVVSGQWRPRLGVLPAAVLMVAAYVVARFVPVLYQFDLVTVVPIALLICAVAAADVRGRSTALRGRVMRWLGERSFGFYMAQAVVLVYGRSVVGGYHQYGTGVAILVILGFFAANVLAGWLLYACVERPVMRRWGRRKQRAPAAAAAAPAVPVPTGVR